MCVRVFVYMCITIHAVYILKSVKRYILSIHNIHLFNMVINY